MPAADRHGYEQIVEPLKLAAYDEDEQEAWAEATFERLDQADLVILPFPILNRLVFEMASMTLDKNQIQIWNELHAAINFEERNLGLPITPNRG
nr:hypothetical protein [Rhodococcus sp. (in: high G+C Gram-positive bacteria)]